MSVNCVIFLHIHTLGRVEFAYERKPASSGGKKISLSDKRASFGGVGFGHSQKVLLCVYDMKNGKCDQYFEAKINFTTRTLA